MTEKGKGVGLPRFPFHQGFQQMFRGVNPHDQDVQEATWADGAELTKEFVGAIVASFPNADDHVPVAQPPSGASLKSSSNSVSRCWRSFVSLVKHGWHPVAIE